MKYPSLYFIAGILVLLVIGHNYTASGQTSSIANHIVINEVEVNPTDDDTKFPAQWVELYNPTNFPVNIGGWTIGATTGLKQAYTISAGTTIQSQQFIVYHYVPIWFPHVGAVVQLKGVNGTVVDQTVPLTDNMGDGNTWQRIYDGYNTGSTSDWAYKSGTPGSSNGKLLTTSTATQLTMSVSTNKQNYTFGDTVNISGQVSQIVQNPAVTSIPQTVNLVLSGPQGFKQTFSLYPGNDLKFYQSVKTDQVLGFAEGSYTISASYGDIQTSSHFSLSSVAFIPPTQAAATTMTLYTDRSNYTISQPIVLLGSVSNVLPLTPVQYKVYDPTNTIVYQGTLFPDDQGKLTTANQFQRSSGNSGLLINTVNPTYGIYRVSATYGSASASTAFDLIPSTLQSQGIIITTDKSVYAPGETVKISGSTKLSGLQNSGLSPTLEIILISATDESRSVPISMHIKTFVNIQSDNSFTYQFTIPATSTSIGNYKVVVSLPFATSYTSFAVSSNPSTYTPVNTGPFSIHTDKSVYGYGDSLLISGQVRPDLLAGTGVQVRILLLNSSGSQIYAQPGFASSYSPSYAPIPLVFTALPDVNGYYSLKQNVVQNIFNTGVYTLQASYGDNLKTSVSFTVSTLFNSSSQNPLSVNTDKKVYGVGDTVKLTGAISSTISGSAFTLTLIQPDGEQTSSPLPVNNGAFSWTWMVPSTARSGTQVTTDRSSSPVVDPTINVYGIYRIKITSANANSDLFFQVSKNPQPNQDIAPIVVMTDKTDYISTDVAKVWGEVIPLQNAASQDTNTAVQILIYSSDGQEIYRGSANINQGGQYYVTVPLHPGIWKTGAYKIYAQYLTNKVISSFNVTDQFATTSTKLQLFMTTDADKYLPGQTVLVTGRTSYIVSINNVDLAFGLAGDTVISEGQVMSKKGDLLPKATVSFDQYGSFSYDYKIPSNAPVGNYTIVAMVPFGSYNAYFNVVSELPSKVVPIINETSTTTGTNQTGSNTTHSTSPSVNIPYTIGPTQKPSKSSNLFVEKTGQLSESVVGVNMNARLVGNATYYPKELDGLLRVNPSDVNSVSIKVSSQDGTCIIGQDSGCKITASTVRSGLYQAVTIDGMDYLVGYSGTGVRLVQFSIIPAHTGDVMPDGQWGVEIIKKDQVTRFYYQVTYGTK